MCRFPAFVFFVFTSAWGKSLGRRVNIAHLIGNAATNQSVPQTKQQRANESQQEDYPRNVSSAIRNVAMNRSMPEMWQQKANEPKGETNSRKAISSFLFAMPGGITRQAVHNTPFRWSPKLVRRKSIRRAPQIRNAGTPGNSWLYPDDSVTSLQTRSENLREIPEGRGQRLLAFSSMLPRLRVPTWLDRCVDRVRRPRVPVERNLRPIISVLPADTSPPPARLSDDAVASIFELIWRDTRKVISEYEFGDILRTIAARTTKPETSKGPRVAQLVYDRWPLLEWYMMFKLDKTASEFCEWLSSMGISPHSEKEVQQQLDIRRAQLWPTLRALLLSRSMNQRLVQAAQTDLKKLNMSSTAAVMSSPFFMIRMWAAIFKVTIYGLQWLLNEFGLRSVLSRPRRQRVRVQLIERAISKGLELQKRVEEIEEQRPTGFRARLGLNGLNRTSSLRVLTTTPGGFELRRAIILTTVASWVSSICYSTSVAGKKLQSVIDRSSRS